MDSRRTFTSGFSRRRISVAARPLSSGMSTSIRTTSGRSSLVLRTASRPSPASPMTTRLSWEARQHDSPQRTTGWSSASSTRTTRLPLGLLELKSTPGATALEAGAPSDFAGIRFICDHSRLLHKVDNQGSTALNTRGPSEAITRGNTGELFKLQDVTNGETFPQGRPHSDRLQPLRLRSAPSFRLSPFRISALVYPTRTR